MIEKVERRVDETSFDKKSFKKTYEKKSFKKNPNLRFDRYVTKYEPYEKLQKSSDGYLLNGDRYVAYTDGASTENQRKDSGGSGCGIHWGGTINGKFCFL